MIETKEKNLILVESINIDYIFALAQQQEDNKVIGQITRDVLRSSIVNAWEVFTDGIRSGIVYISYLPAFGYTLDAYKDKKILNPIHYSIEAGRMVLEWFDKNINQPLLSIHSKDNKMATLACRRLGFEKIDEIDSCFGKFTVMKRTKE